jgi:hypothetical protein
MYFYKEANVSFFLPPKLAPDRQLVRTYVHMDARPFLSHPIPFYGFREPLRVVPVHMSRWTATHLQHQEARSKRPRDFFFTHKFQVHLFTSSNRETIFQVIDSVNLVVDCGCRGRW